MITAIDTDILLDILLPNEDFFDIAASTLQDSADKGSLVVSDIVYAELCIHFEHQAECDSFLESSDIRVQALPREAHFPSSRAWRMYRQQGGQRTRVLADCLIGAHAASRQTGCCPEIAASIRICFPR